jgi:hypothetical protein
MYRREWRRATKARDEGGAAGPGHQLSQLCYEFQRIIESADELGDRWRCLARVQRGRKVRTPESRAARRAIPRATRLVTPGGRSQHAGESRRAGNAATDSATENKPPVGDAPLRWIEGKPCEPPVWAVPPVRVKRWGKSPPRGWQHSRHGKPRVEQGQIGGEGRPGPLGPSGRLLESRSDSGPRGMIAGARKRSTESGLQAHPPTSFGLTDFLRFDWGSPICASMTSMSPDG